MGNTGFQTTSPLAASVKPSVIWQPQPIQAIALICPILDMLYGGARGGGKSDFLIADFLTHAETYGKHARGLIIRRTLEELSNIRERMLELYSQLGATFSVKHNCFYFPNGATLKLRYLASDADAQNYQGHEYTWIGIDEVGNFKAVEPIDKLRATLRSSKKDALGRPIRKSFRLTGNPGGPGHGWLKERYITGKDIGKAYFRVPIKGTNPLQYKYYPYGSEIPPEDLKKGCWQVFIKSLLEDNRILMENDPGYEAQIESSGPTHLVKAWREGDWDAVADGKVLLADWWKRYEVLPPENTRLHIIQSWDIAFKDGQDNDRSVCTTWGIYECGYFLLDCFADRLLFPDLKKKAVELAEKWQCYEVLVEDKAAGISLIQELQRNTNLALRPINPKGDKLARAYAASPLVESGKVFIPLVADWLDDFITETSGFPEAKHDDIVDSVSQALIHISSRFAVSRSYTFESIKATTASTNQSPAITTGLQMTPTPINSDRINSRRKFY